MACTQAIAHRLAHRWRCSQAVSRLRHHRRMVVVFQRSVMPGSRVLKRVHVVVGLREAESQDRGTGFCQIVKNECDAMTLEV